MPKFRIIYEQRVTHTVVVTAPTELAARRFSARSTGAEFHPHTQFGWDFSDLFEDPAADATLEVDADGKVIDA